MEQTDTEGPSYRRELKVVSLRGAVENTDGNTSNIVVTMFVLNVIILL